MKFGISFLTNLVVVALSPLAYYLETSESDNKTKAYWILFTILGTFNLIAFILSFFINTEPFIYEEKSEKESLKPKEIKGTIGKEMILKDSIND